MQMFKSNNDKVATSNENIFDSKSILRLFGPSFIYVKYFLKITHMYKLIPVHLFFTKKFQVDSLEDIKSNKTKQNAIKRNEIPIYM